MLSVRMFIHTSVRVRPHFSQNKFQVKTMFTTGETLGLVEWIIDDTFFLSFVCFQFSLSIKQEEKHRLDKVLREEEAELQKAEAELRLAQQAFDQFLHENDSRAIEAQKR